MMNPPTSHFALAISVSRSFARLLFVLGLLLWLPLPSLLARAQTNTSATAVAQSTEVRMLKAGEPVERELAGGQSHFYQISLRAGEYVNVVVEQRGIDVVVVLIRPDGNVLESLNNEPQREGVENIEWVAATPGNYQLKVLPAQKVLPSGQYAIRLVGLRDAGNQDLALQEARRLMIDFDKLYRNAGYDEARPLAERALRLREQLLGPDHLDVAVALIGLANLYRDKGDYLKAIEMYQRVLIIREKQLGPAHLVVAQTLNNQAIAYALSGDNSKAEELTKRVIIIKEKVLGVEHPSVASSINNLAIIYETKGDYRMAELFFQRTLSIREKVLEPNHPDIAISLNNLANLYQDLGNYEKAQQLYQRSLVISEKTLGPEHLDVSMILNNLAALQWNRGELEEAQTLCLRALAIREKLLGKVHPNVADTLDILASVYTSKRVYVEADQLYQRALAIREKMLGAEHPDVAASLNNLAVLYAANGELEKAIALRTRACTVSEHNIWLNLATGSDRQKLAYLAKFNAESHQTISLHVHYATNNSAARDLSLNTILQRKGRVLDATADSIAALRKRANADDRALLDQLQTINAELAGLVLNGPQDITLVEHQARIKSLEEQKEKLEDDISARSAEFRAQSVPVTFAAVQAAIPTQAALVEFVRYRPFNAKFKQADEQFGTSRYVAYVLHRQGEAQWVELGEAKAIDDALEKLRQALRDKRRKDVKQLARAVDEKVMRPVRALLGQTRRVFISPDGALNLIPFAALVDEHNRYLVQRYEFSYLTSGRDLLRLQVKQPSKQTALVVANPDFDDDTQAGAARQRGLVYRPGTKAATGEGAVLAGYYFPPLQGTAGEARALKAMMADATVLTQAQATEAALKQISAPRLLHIATHGFFLENQSSVAEERGLKSVKLGEPATTGQLANPLLRSGLALAGANRPASDTGDDGILTAQEAAGLDLWGTKLVVLSACDTGVGEVKNGEGVYGLRRALVLAGSETQVMSLWPVSDKGTRDLMIEYYRRLLRGEERSAALRQVQLRMLASQGRGEKGPSRLLVTKGLPEATTKDKRTARDYSHPYYWASFIQSGEWRKLD